MIPPKQTYDACAKWMAGDKTSAEALGLEIRNLSDANRLMTEAFKGLTVEQRAQDYWTTSKDGT
jgi:hypothetical protein